MVPRTCVEAAATRLWSSNLTCCIAICCLGAASVSVSVVAAVDAADESLTFEQRLQAEDAADLAREARDKGDAGRGAIVFYQPQLNCIKCHTMDPEDTKLAPDLTKGGEEVTDVYLVEALLLPSKVLKKGYEPRIVITDRGKPISGLLIEEREDAIVLRDPAKDDEPIVISLDSIDEEFQGRTSVMPTGLVNALTSRQQFLDLVRYLMEITEHGLERARQLQPPPSLYAVRPLPEYENDIDHAGMIGGLNRECFDRGKKIYDRLCVNCHGTVEQPGSLPTSLRFAEGQFKHGNDPYTMYQTLTKGYGMMVAQAWMVPQQKYDVIHYIREAYLKPHNPGQYATIDDAYLAGLPAGSTRGPEPKEYAPWSDMDYGPNLIASYEIGEDQTNFAYKGIAIRLDTGPGGVSRGKYWMVFDHDTLRAAAGWTGEGFIDWNGIMLNGRHGVHPRVVGEVQFQNKTGPGWGRPDDGSFEDPRLRGRDDRPYGPLPRDWAKYRGLYHYADKVILSYTVGGTDVLEMPGIVTSTSQPAFTRSFNLGARDRDLVLQVAQQEPGGRVLRQVDGEAPGFATAVVYGADLGEATRGFTNRVSFDGRTCVQVDAGDAFDMTRSDYTISARVRTSHDGTIFAKTAPGKDWVHDGKSLFIRDGRLVFDIGWVGAVQAKRVVADDEWHDIALTYQHQDGRIRLYVDGELDGQGRLKPGRPVSGHCVRLGYTSSTFPREVSYLRGDLVDVRFYRRAATPAELSRSERAEDVEADQVAGWRLDETRSGVVPDQTEAGLDGAIVRDAVATTVLPLAAGVSPAVEGIRWEATREGEIRLTIPAGPQPLRFTLWMSQVDHVAAAAELASELEAESWAVNLESLIHGGPTLWSESLTTQAVRGEEDGPFAVDTLTHPAANPWMCRTRLTGFDFFNDGNRAAVCSWDGDVWIVEGILGKGDESASFPLTWRRIGCGLFQPLGLKVVDEQIYVTCRDQLVILRDLNGDGQTDFYECFNNDHQVTEHFHEFAMGLQRDDQGNFYYAKSARHGLPALVPHHGTLLRISADGSRTDILAKGFRAANGVCINPDGTFFVTDQEGHWMPKNRINWVKGEGRFYGNMWGYHDVTDPSDDRMEPPLCWITNAMDRSPAELVWVDSPVWGPLQGSLLNFSYGYGKIYIVPHEKMGDHMQGGVCQLPLPVFPTGTMRGRFHPGDGQLYTCGMFAWAGNQQQPGGFYRVRYTGKPVYLPIGLNATEEGIRITFSGRLDAATAADPENFAVKIWSLKRSANYGSDHYNEHPLEVASARCCNDDRAVQIVLPEIQPTWCMEIRYRLKAFDGESFEGTVHNTIHALGPSR